MSVIGSIGLAAAERLERSVGPAVALRSYRALLSDDDHAVVTRATLGAVRCALALGDAPELAALADFWETQTEIDADDSMVDACMNLCRDSRWQQAQTLVRAETQRRPSAKSWYLRARVAETLGDAREASACFERAADTGRSRGAAGALIVSAQVKCLEALFNGGASDPQLVARAEEIDLSCASGAQKLLVARARLRSTGRFARASALSTLEELAGGENADLAAAAVACAAQHADEAGEALSWVEADRIATALQHWPDASQREHALKRLRARQQIAAAGEDDIERAIELAAQAEPSVVRFVDGVRALLTSGWRRSTAAFGADEGDGAAAADQPSAGDALRCANRALAAVAACEEGRPEAAAAALDRASEAMPENDVAPAALWTATLLALRSSDPGLRDRGVEAAGSLIGRARGTPPRGYAPYALALQQAGADELALAALRAAARRAEPGAPESLASQVARQGWRAYQRGDRHSAIGLLKEAKLLWARCEAQRAQPPPQRGADV